MTPANTRSKIVRLTLNDKQKAYLEQIKANQEKYDKEKLEQSQKLNFVCYVADGSKLLANIKMAKRKYDVKSQSAVDLHELERQAEAAEMALSLRRTSSMKRLASPESLECD